MFETGTSAIMDSDPPSSQTATGEPDMLFGKLTVLYRNGRQETVELTKPAMDLGSAAENDVILRDPFVDQRHARLTYSERGCQVLDLGSPTGTIVDGTALSPNMAQLLRDGAVIQIGRVQLIYRASAPAVEAEQSKGKTRRPKQRAAAPATSGTQRRLPRRPLFFIEAVMLVVVAAGIGGLVVIRPWEDGAIAPAVVALPAVEPSAATTVIPTAPAAGLICGYHQRGRAPERAGCAGSERRACRAAGQRSRGARGRGAGS